MNTNEKNLNLVADNVDSYDNYHDTGSNGRHFLNADFADADFRTLFMPFSFYFQSVLYLRSLIIA